MTCLFHKYKNLLCLYVVAGAMPLAAQVLVSGPYQSPMFSVTFGTSSVIQLQPSNALYNFHDGGLEKDACFPQVNFDVPTKEMLVNVEYNMDTRIQDLHKRADNVHQTLKASMPAILDFHNKQTAQTIQTNNQLKATAMQAPLVLDKIRQDKQDAYLKNLQSYRESSAKELQDALGKRQLSQQAVTDLEKIKNELLDETAWHSNDWALISSLIASNANAHANLIYDLLALNPALANNPVVGTLSEVKILFEESLINGTLDPKVIRDGYLNARLIDALTAGKDLLGMANAFASYGKSVAAMTEAPADQAAMKLEIANQLARIDQEIERYRERIGTTNAVIEYHQYIQQAIRDYFKVNGMDEKGLPSPVPDRLPPAHLISPQGLPGISSHIQDQAFGKETSYAARSIAAEKAKAEHDFSGILERFNQYTSLGQTDPVFSSLNSYEDTKRQARMCLDYAGNINRDIEDIQKDYPGTDSKLIMEWVQAGKEVRYMADRYLPYADKQFRFTTVDMDLLRTEMTQAITYIQQHQVIPDYACNIYTATLLEKLYNIDPALFRNQQGDWLNANQIAARASFDTHFNAIGPALNQGNLDQAAYFATIGKPVIAVYFSPTGHGHISLVLPGLNAGASSRSGSWDMWVPMITNYSLTTSGECTGCFTDGKMSDAFSKAKAETTILYWLSR